MLDQCNHRPEPYTARMGHDRNVTRRDTGILAGEDRRRGIRQLSPNPPKDGRRQMKRGWVGLRKQFSGMDLG